MALTAAVIVVLLGVLVLGLVVRAEILSARDAVIHTIQSDSDTWLDRERQADAKRQAQAALWKTGEGREALRARLLKRLDDAKP
jgi:hypothetical protein